ncbi:hypothetical protein F5X98DRAFT_324934 [Xylaria grammica]|nr:hypothetical protein F5X98DRAFT_324934 [Xylaria grammica]
MATASASISDDWEHVEDTDSFSVISLSMSDDGSTDRPRDRPAIPALSTPPDNLDHQPHQSHRPPAQSLVCPREIGEEPDESQAVERCGMDMADVVEPDTPPAQPKEGINNDTNFDSICSTTSSLIKLIPAMPTDPCHCAPDIITKTKNLGAHLCHLEDILQGYAKHRRPSNRRAELPLGLSEWLGSLKSELLSIQERLDDPTTWSQAAEKLESFSSQMDGLMSVIQSDYEDFHTLNMPVLASQGPHATHRGPGRYASRITSGSNGLAHLRRELYTLRDQIVACLGEIHSCLHSDTFNNRDQRKDMKDLTLSYKKTKESLELMLSNHGSDWIDYSLAGGLTYPEFCRLNPDTIRSLILQLKEVTDDLFLERTRVQSLHYGNDPDGVLQGERMLIEESSFNTLRAIEEVLVSILQLRKDAY